MKIGVMYGSPETTAGGNALKFYASVRLDIRKIGTITENSDVLGNRVRVKVVKNKVAPPFREAEFDVIFNEGISRIGETIDIGVDKGIVDRSGAWYSFKGERLGQGREGAKTFLKENPEIAQEIRSLVLSTLGIENSVLPLSKKVSAVPLGDSLDSELGDEIAVDEVAEKAVKAKKGKKAEASGAGAE